VRHRPAGSQERGELDRVVAAARTRRQDVAEAAGVVLPVGAGRRARRAGQLRELCVGGRREDEQQEGNYQEPEHGRTLQYP
jgi:hypothetical protein